MSKSKKVNKAAVVKAAKKQAAKKAVATSLAPLVKLLAGVPTADKVSDWKPDLHFTGVYGELPTIAGIVEPHVDHLAAYWLAANSLLPLLGYSLELQFKDVPAANEAMMKCRNEYESLPAVQEDKEVIQQFGGMFVGYEATVIGAGRPTNLKVVAITPAIADTPAWADVLINGGEHRLRINPIAFPFRLSDVVCLIASHAAKLPLGDGGNWASFDLGDPANTERWLINKQKIGERIVFFADTFARVSEFSQ